MKSASKLILGCGALASIFLCSYSPVSAAPSEFNIDVEPILSIKIDDSTSSSPTATGHTATSDLAVASTTIEFTTNNLTGFEVTMSTDKLSTETNATSLVHLTANDSIPTLTADYAKANFPVNYWGYSLDDATYKPMVSKSAPVKIISSTGPISDSQDFYFAAKADSTKISGTYYATVLITAVAKSVPMTLEESYASAGAEKVTTANGKYYAMQDMTSEICANAEVAETTMKVADIRDGKVYWITKMSNGQCWMTQNLDLDITEDGFDSTTTDIGYAAYIADGTIKTWDSTSTYAPASTVVYSGNSVRANDELEDELDDDINATGSVDVGMRYATDGDGDWLNTYSGDEHYSIGNFYQWETAVAGSGSELSESDMIADDSICPKGWRIIASSGTYNNAGLVDYVSTSIKDVLDEPVYSVFSGRLETDSDAQWRFTDAYVGEEESQVYSMYWTDEAENSNNAYGVGFPNSVGLKRYDALAIRCVARQN